MAARSMKIPAEVVRAEELIRARLGELARDGDGSLGRAEGLTEARGLLLQAVVEVGNEGPR